MKFSLSMNAMHSSLQQVTTIAADIDNYKGCEFNLLDLASRLEDYTGPPLVNKSRQVLKRACVYDEYACS